MYRLDTMFLLTAEAVAAVTLASPGGLGLTRKGFCSM